ncbi:MAG: AI-2E family transporter [Desulfuromonadales bacterium]|uniref:AI-2E family transporter n=1 Tax=Desulfuromonas sp. KJ2020 TaxID=2919173 RepID=UPI0003222A29|nr:AI-2E family transporter [Desulfuromonas sp. KJ2020]MCP3177216.1 AI-2E family transporter [Desulfuromonas sp. KJ2020]
MTDSRKLTRPQIVLLYLVLTAGIASGLAIFSSATNVFGLLRTATAGLILPLLLAMITAFLLDPLVKYLERDHISRTFSIFIVYLLISSALYLAARWLVPQWVDMWNSLRTDIPRYAGNLVAFVKEVQLSLQARLPMIQGYEFTSKARDLIEGVVGYLLVQTPKSALRLGSLLILVPLFSFFFLRDGRKILRSTISLAPNRQFEMLHDLSFHISQQMAHFIRGRILEAFIVGVVVAVGLSFTDIRYAPLLGLFAGVTNLVPYIGPIVGMIPGLLIALTDLGMGGQFWWIVMVYVLIAQVIVDNFILIPILISRVSNLHPLWVLLAIIMGGKLYGVLGMIIGVPIASIIKIAILETRHYRRTFQLPEQIAEPDRHH